MGKKLIVLGADFSTNGWKTLDYKDYMMIDTADENAAKTTLDLLSQGVQLSMGAGTIVMSCYATINSTETTMLLNTVGATGIRNQFKLKYAGSQSKSRLQYFLRGTSGGQSTTYFATVGETIKMREIRTTLNFSINSYTVNRYEDGEFFDTTQGLIEPTGSGTTPLDHFWLWGNTGDTSIANEYIRYKYIQFLDGSNTVYADFRPALDEDNTPCLVDIASQTMTKYYPSVGAIICGDF